MNAETGALQDGKRCGILHELGGQTCIRRKGHEGYCESRSERGPTGTLTYSQWESRDGKFYSHVGYQTIYPKNAIH